MHLQLLELLQNSSFVKNLREAKKSFLDLFLLVEHQRKLMVVTIP